MAAFPFTEEGVSGALAALGTTPNQVADTLLDGGYRGNPACDATCPVATYLTDLWPDATCSVTEEPPDALIAEVWYSTTACVQVPVPDPVSAFIRRFDGGEFGELNRRIEVSP